MDYVEKQRHIILKLGSEEILSQLSEECCELSVAAQKVRRVLHGTTPVIMEKALAMLQEEAGDVLLLLDCLERMSLYDPVGAKTSAQGKNIRWFQRIFGS